MMHVFEKYHGLIAIGMFFFRKWEIMACSKFEISEQAPSKLSVNLDHQNSSYSKYKQSHC